MEGKNNLMIQRFTVYLGDLCSIPFLIQGADGSIFTPDYIDEIELIIGRLRRTYKEDLIKFDSSTYNFILPLTLEETFSFYPAEYQSSIRVKFKDFTGVNQMEVHSFMGPSIVVLKSKSSVIL